eukprot:gene8362-9212_t
MEKVSSFTNSLFGSKNGGGDRNTIGFVAAALVFFALGSWLKARRLSRSTGGRRTRSLSFSSATLLSGTFPEKAAVRQPIVNGVLYFNTCPDLEAIIKNVEYLMYYDRMRSGTIIVNGKPELVDLEDVPQCARDIVTSTIVNNDQELQDVVNKIVATEIEFEEKKALWRMHRIENRNGRHAVLVRIHHVIGDGMAMISLMNGFFHDEHGKRLNIDIAEKKKAIGGKGMKFSLSTIPTFIKSALEVILLPHSAYDSNIAFFPHHNAQVSMKGRRSVEFPTVKLEFIKAIKNKANVTVNDVLLAATSGMIRRYSEIKGDNVFTSSKSPQVRALMPLAFPRRGEDLKTPDRSLRNLWAMLSVPMSVQSPSPLDRLQEAAKTTKKLKTSPNALIQLLIQNRFLGLLPNWFSQQLAFDVFSRHSIVFSNVPGPNHPVYYCGQRIEGMQITFPNLIPQVILISYYGGVFFNLSIDSDEVDCKLLCELYLQELRNMAEGLGLDASDSAVLHTW